MAKVLGKVTGEIAVRRGPDALHKIKVPQDWLEQGATIEFELPRNLTCAKCDGGGCDACERSGAVSTRGRKEIPETIQVTLPREDPSDAPPSSGKRGLMVRIPEHGGLPAEDEVLPRGILLLSVRVGSPEEAKVDRIRLSVPVEAPPTPPPPAPAPQAPLGIPTWAWVVAAIVAVLWAIIILTSRS